MDYISDLPQGQKVTLVGHSRGAVHAYNIAESMPGRISTLVTIDPTGGPLRDTFWGIKGRGPVWINVNASAPGSSGGDWVTNADRLQGGGDWGDRPNGWAWYHFSDSGAHHEDFEYMMTRLCNTNGLQRGGAMLRRCIGVAMISVVVAALCSCSSVAAQLHETRVQAVTMSKIHQRPELLEYWGAATPEDRFLDMEIETAVDYRFFGLQNHYAIGARASLCNELRFDKLRSVAVNAHAIYDRNGIVKQYGTPEGYRPHLDSKGRYAFHVFVAVSSRFHKYSSRYDLASDPEDVCVEIYGLGGQPNPRTQTQFATLVLVPKSMIVEAIGQWKAPREVR